MSTAVEEGTGTLEVTELDVDLERNVPCSMRICNHALGEHAQSAGFRQCPNPAEFHVKAACRHGRMWLFMCSRCLRLTRWGAAEHKGCGCTIWLV